MAKKERYEVLFEDISSKFNVLIEGHQVLNKKIDDLRDELKREIDDRCSLLEFGHKAMGEEIRNIVEKLGNTRDELKETKEELSKRIEDTRKELKETKEELSKRIEDTRKELGAKIDKVVKRIEDHEIRIERIERTVGV